MSDSPSKVRFRDPREMIDSSHPPRLEARRICVVLLTGIGDVVHGLPVVNALMDEDPLREIVWVAEPGPAQLLRGHPSVREVVVFEKRSGIGGVLRLWRELRGRSFDLALNLQRYFKSVFPTIFSGAEVRIGLPPSKTRDGVSWFNTHHIAEAPWKHTQDLFLDALDVLGVREPGRLEWRISLSPDEEREARSFFSRFDDRPVVGVVTGTANPRKDWIPGSYLPLVEALENDFGFQVLLLGGPGRRERETARRIMAGSGAAPVWGMEDSVRRLISKIRGSRLVISPDTGPVHIAHALDVPVIGLYGHTNPWRVGPYSKYHDLWVDRYTEPGEPPDPSGYDSKEGRMELIDVESVLERVERARERYGL